MTSRLIEGKCNDVLAEFTPSLSKQACNDAPDCRLFDLFALKMATVLTFKEYLGIVTEKSSGI